MNIFQKGFNYSQDGPGNRLIYHLQGCNFFCRWCSNPEGMELKNAKMIQMSPQQVIAEAISCKPMFFEGGGVTFTGGECTMQHDELLTVLKGLKENHISTCIETNGSDARIDELLPYIDFLIMDFKHFNPEIHRQWIGVKNEQTLINLGRILDSKRQILIRIPLIHNVNVQPEGFVKFFKEHCMDHACIEILPYHEYGKDKWTKEYLMKDGFVSKEEIKMMMDAFKAEGFRIIHT